MIIAKLEKILEKVNTSQIALFAVLIITVITGVIALKNEFFSGSKWYEGTWYLDSASSFQNMDIELKKQIGEFNPTRVDIERFLDGHPESSKLARGLIAYKGNAKKRWELIFDNVSLSINLGNNYGFFETNLPQMDKVTSNSSSHNRTYRNKMFDFDIEQIVRNESPQLVLIPSVKRRIHSVNSDGKRIEKEKAFEKSIAQKKGEYLIINMPLVSFSKVNGSNSSDKIIRGDLYFRKI